MAEKITESELKQKDWVSPADEIEQRGNPSFFEWRHDSYHAFSQMQQAISDPDVQICDVEREDGQVIVNLQGVGSPSGYPTGSLRSLSNLASERFQQKQDDPDYGAWDEEVPWAHLNWTIGQVDDAMGAVDRGDDVDELEAKEQIADALNYLLFAYHVIDQDDS